MLLVGMNSWIQSSSEIDAHPPATRPVKTAPRSGVLRAGIATALVAIVLLMAACLLALFSGNRITSYVPLAMAIFIQEMVLAVWLIVKGFDPAAVAALLAKAAAAGL